MAQSGGTLGELRARGQLRRHIARHVLFKDHVEEDQARTGADMDNPLAADYAMEPAGSAGVHHLAVTLLAGHHFPNNATTFRDVKYVAQSVVATLANAIKHLASNDGKTPMPPTPVAHTPKLRDGCTGSYMVDAYLECIPSERQSELVKSAHDFDPYFNEIMKKWETRPRMVPNTFHVCVGYRLHWILRVLPNRNPAVIAAAEAARAAAEAEAAEAEGRRRRGPGRQPAARAQQLRMIRERTADDPLACGLAANFHEAALINARAKTERQAIVNKKSTTQGLFFPS